MDRPGELDDTWRKDLANLQSLNRFFGAYRIIRWFLRHRLEPGGQATVLDLATGSADIPRLVVALARGRGVEVSIDAVDAHPATRAVAEEGCAAYPEIRVLDGDARTFEGEGNYDFVFCSLALHHFSEADARTLLANASRRACRAVLVADLERSLLAMAGIYAVTAIVYRDPMTVTDARMSAHAAFSKNEFQKLAESAGWEGAGYRRFLYGRQAVWLDKGV